MSPVDLQTFGVDNHDVAATRDKQPLAVLVVREVVPEAFTAELDAVGDFEFLLRESGDGRENSGREKNGNNAFHDLSLHGRQRVRRREVLLDKPDAAQIKSVPTIRLNPGGP